MDIYTRFSESVAFRMRMDKPAEIMNLTWALGLVGETGEVVDLIKKHIGHGHPLDRPKLVKELGDVEWYMEAIRQAYKFTREDVVVSNSLYNNSTEVNTCVETLLLAREVGRVASFDEKHLIRVGLNVIDIRLCNIYTIFNITREEALEANIAKLTERYPNGFSTEASINRKDVQSA